ncbi:MAG: ROK family protein [Candidatus Saccharimonadales bacterium]
MYGAVDIGGTKTLVAVFDDSGKVVEQIKFPTPKDYKDFKIELAKTVASLSTKDFIQTVVAAPGKIDRKHGIGLVFGNLPWIKIPIQQDVEAMFKCPVSVENDANLAGLSEALAIEDKYHKVLYVTVSTGIGSGFVVNGRIDPDTEDAEIGHILLPYKGELKRWQEFASGRAIVANFGKRASDIPASDTKTWDAIARNIAIGMIDIIATLTPDAIVIGGGVGSHLDKFKIPLENAMKKYDNPMVTIPPILNAKNSEEAVIYGCYAYAKQHSNAK